MDTLEYANGNTFTGELKANTVPVLVVLTLIGPCLIYLWQSGKANSDEIIRLKAETASTKVVTEKIEDLRSEVKSDINNLRSEVKSDINNLRSEVKSDIENLRIRVDSGFQDINKILLERLPPKKK